MRKKIFGVLMLAALVSLFAAVAAWEQGAVAGRQFLPWAATSLIGFAGFGWLSGAMEFGPRLEDVWATIRRRATGQDESNELPRRRTVTVRPDGSRTISYR